MIRAEQFRLSTVQAVAYLANPEDFSKSNVLSAILSSYAARYNGDVQVLPLPEDIPSEVPRIILQSDPPRWELRASPARIDSMWGLLALDEEPGDVVADCAEVLERYVREANVRIGRLALVLSRFTMVDDPATQLIEHFCNDRAIAGPLRRSETFELHNHKRYKPETMNEQVNSWVRCKSGRLVSDGSPIINVEQDLNTLEEERETNVFPADQISEFFANASAEADSILLVYFPSEEG
jgi:hypothetical protein